MSAVRWPVDEHGSRLRGLKLLRELFERAKNERSSPHLVGCSVAVGVFSGFTPFLGFHMWIALGAATVLRLNRLWALLGSHLSILPLYMWVSFCEIQVGHRLRAGAWVELAPQEALAHGSQLFTDWLLGTGVVAGGLAGVLGVVAYFAARGWQRRRPSVKPRTLASLPPPSSESRPSAPPAPTA